MAVDLPYFLFPRCSYTVLLRLATCKLPDLLCRHNTTAQKHQKALTVSSSLLETYYE